MNEPKLVRSHDFSIIEKLARGIWHRHYVPMIGAPQVEYMLEKFYSKEALALQQMQGQQFWMIYLDERPCGYIGISEQQSDECFLHKFYIDTSLHRHGIGSMVFALLIAAYPKTSTIRLQVNINNYKSINFYFKCGFTIESRLVVDIGNGFVMDDYIMIWKKNQIRSESS